MNPDKIKVRKKDTHNMLYKLYNDNLCIESYFKVHKSDLVVMIAQYKNGEHFPSSEDFKKTYDIKNARELWNGKCRNGYRQVEVERIYENMAPWETKK